MKKIILAVLLIATVLFASCASPNDDGIYTTKSHPTEHLYDELTTITVTNERGELCEYVLYDRGITHSGNCKYCKARHDKENDSLVERIANEVYNKMMNQ